jgi:hypothetical protein
MILFYVLNLYFIIKYNDELYKEKKIHKSF